MSKKEVLVFIGLTRYYRKFILNCSANFLQLTYSLVERILGHPPCLTPYLQSFINVLVDAADRPDWSSIEDIDIPLRQ